MMEALRPSLDEASQGKDLNTKEAALDYIGRRALGQTTSRANRIKHAQVGICVRVCVLIDRLIGTDARQINTYERTER